MNNYQRIYEKTIEEAKLKEEVKSAKERFTPKPFVSEYYQLKQAALYFRPVLSLFSVITGFAFLFYNFNTNLPIIVSACFAILLLVMLEYLKAETITLSIRKVLMTSKISHIVLLLFSFAFFALSVFCSVSGAKELYLQTDNNLEEYQIQVKSQQHNLIEDYESKIKSEKKDLNEFKASVSWQGKINLQNKTVAQTLSSHTAKIDSLEAQKARHLQAISAQSQQDIKELEDETGFNIIFWIVLSVCNEFLLFISLTFPVCYQFKAASESEIFAHSLPLFNMSLHDFKQFASNLLLHNTEEWHIPLSENLPNTKQQATPYEASDTSPPYTAQAPTHNKDKTKVYEADLEVENREEMSQNKRKPRSNSYDYERIRELKDKGLKVKEIASLLNCSETTIRRARMAK